MTTLSFTIPIKPVPWSVKKGYKALYTPSKVRQWEKDVGWHAKLAMKKAGYSKPFFNPIKLFLTFHMPIPKTRQLRQKRDKTWVGLKPGEPHTQDPDLRNLSKSTEDGLKRIVFGDDCQVWRDGDEKIWAEVGSVDVKVEIG